MRHARQTIAKFAPLAWMTAAAVLSVWISPTAGTKALAELSMLGVFICCVVDVLIPDARGSRS